MTPAVGNGAASRRGSPTQPISPTHYVDAAAFTRLFRQRHKNHAEICLGLNLIVAGVSRRFWFASAHDKQDAIANSLLFAVERIDRFNPKVGNDAFAYFTQVIFNCLRRQMKDFGRRFIRCVPMDDSALDKLDSETSYSRAI